MASISIKTEIKLESEGLLLDFAQDNIKDCTEIDHRRIEDEPLVGGGDLIDIGEVKVEFRLEETGQSDKSSATLKQTLDDQYSCSECNQSFSRKIQLQNHVKTHSLKDQQSSNTDDEHGTDYSSATSAATSKQSIPANKATDDSVQLPQCDVCHKTFSEKRKLWNHKRFHQPKNHVCQVCKTSFSDKWSLKIHENKHNQSSQIKKAKPKDKIRERNKRSKLRSQAGGPFKCDLCPMIFLYDHSVPAHMRKVHEPKKYACECGDKYATRSYLLKHIQRRNKGVTTETEHKESPTNESQPSSFPCSNCDKVYSSAIGLWNHCRYVHKKQHVCSMCSISCESEENLARHIKLKHNLESKDSIPGQECDFCKESLPNAMELRRHKETLKHYCCKPCNKTYGKSWFLRAHIKRAHRHDGESFECKTCNKVFSTYVQRFAHMKSHNLKEHACASCNKVYLNHAWLMKHWESSYNKCRQPENMNFEDSPITHVPENDSNEGIAASLVENKLGEGKHTDQKAQTVKSQKNRSNLSRKEVHNRNRLGKHLTTKSIKKQTMLKEQRKAADLPSRKTSNGLSCSKCSRTFNRQCQLEMHLRSHVTETTERNENGGDERVPEEAGSDFSADSSDDDPSFL